MIYFLKLPQLGYSKKENSKDFNRLKVIAEVRLEFDLYRVDDNLLFIRENSSTSLLIEILGLSCVEGDIQYEWYQGGATADSQSSLDLKLFDIPSHISKAVFRRKK